MFSKYHLRTVNIIKHIGLNFLFKGGSIVISLLFIPLSIRFLGEDKYGIWLTLFSFIAWFNFLDFGLGHGLRNYLTKAIAQGDISLAKRYISTAYNSILFIAILLIVLFFFIQQFIDWQLIFKIPKQDLSSFLSLLKIVILSFFINLVLKLIDILFFSILKPSIPGMLQFINSLFSFIVIYIMLLNGNKSLINYGATVVGIQTIIFLITNLIVFNYSYKSIRPVFFYFEKNIAKNIFGLGGKFFLIQVAAIILYSTDNMIITQLFSPKDVTVYNIAFKYFGLITMTSTLFLYPLWSAITDAEESNDKLWIRKMIKKSLLLVTALSILSICMYFFSDIFYSLWVGDSIKVPSSLSLVMSFYVISSIFLQVFTMYLNGVGKVKIQLIIGCSMALLNIPLSIFFSKTLEMGLTGVIFATLICNLTPLIFFIIQYNKLINQRAFGIWNK